MEQQLDQSGQSYDGGVGSQSQPQFDVGQQQPQWNSGVDWRANLPPELQGPMQRFNNPEALAKAYMDANSLVSRKVGEFSQQDWERYAAIQEINSGIPSSPDKYEIDQTQNEGKYDTFTEEDTEALKEVSHAMGLNKDQSQQLYNVMNEIGNRILEQTQDAADLRTQTSLQELERDWGNAYQSKLNAADVCIEQILPKLIGVSSDAVREEMSNLGFQSSAVMMKMLAALGELCSEGSSAGYNNISPMDAAMRFDHLKNDPRTAEIMTNPRHPAYNQVREEFRTLSEIVHGGR